MSQSSKADLAEMTLVTFKVRVRSYLVAEVFVVQLVRWVSNLLMGNPTS